MTTHAEHHPLPVVPFTDAERDSMRADDVTAAKYIASLTTGIFGIGFVLYLLVLISSGVQDLIYTSVR